MILQELPAFSFLHSFEIVGHQFHALEIEIWCVAHSCELKHIHHILYRKPITQYLRATLLQLWDRVHVGQCQQMNPILLPLLLWTPKTPVTLLSFHTINPFYSLCLILFLNWLWWLLIWNVNFNQKRGIYHEYISHLSRTRLNNLMERNLYHMTATWYILIT